jgi:hypothetical protein
VSFILQPSSSVAAPTYSVISTSGNVSAGQLLLVDTSGGAITLTLPAAPGNGDSIYFQDGKGTWDSNPLTINRNGKTIQGLAENLIAANENGGFGLVYNGTEWRTY